MDKNILYIILIACAILAIVVSIAIIIKLYQFNKSRSKYNLRKVKIGDDYYELYPTNNHKGLKAIEMTIHDETNTGEMIRKFENIEEVSNEVVKGKVDLKEYKKEEPKISFTKSKIKIDKKRKTVFLYSNIANPFLKIYKYNNSKLEQMIKINLADYQVENGIIVNIEKLAEVIKNENIVVTDIDLVLQINESFKNVISLPKMSSSRANNIYHKNLKEDFDSVKDKYLTFNSIYKHALGYAYYTFFIPNNIINSFKKLALLLNYKISSVNLFGNLLLGLASLEVKGDFAGVYVKDKVCTIFNSFAGNLTTICDFYVNDASDIIDKYLLMVSKHEFELEKKTTTTVLIGIEDEMTLDLFGLKPIEYYFNFENYFNNGIKL